MAIRHWRGTDPPLGQANLLTNGYVQPQVQRAKLPRPPYAKRGRTISPPWFQANVLTNGYVQPAVMRAKRIQPPYARRGHVWSALVTQAVSAAPGIIFPDGYTRRGWSQAKHGRVFSPPWGQANALTNGYVVPVVQRGRRSRPPYAKRGDVWSAPISQAVAVNPAIVLPTGYRRRHYPMIRSIRGHAIEPAWPQASQVISAPYNKSTFLLLGV